MNGSEEKNEETAEISTAEENKPIDSITPEPSSASEEQTPQKKKVRMKWGRVIEDPDSEASPIKKEHEEKPFGEHRPDPRIEALRERLLREEQERAERKQREKAAEQEAREKAERAAEEMPTMPPPSSEKKGEKRRGKPDKKRRARQAPSDAERPHAGESYGRAADIMRMEEELYRAELKKKLRKKRRKEAFSDFWILLLGAVLTLPRRIRISKRFVIALTATLLLSGITAVILGNLLKARVDVGGDDGETSESTEAESEESFFTRGFDVPEVNAGIVSLENATAKGLRSEARRFYDAGVSAVSLVLRDNEGTLLFSAKADNALGIDRGAESLLSIDEILSPFLEYELYVSCLLPMRYGIDGDAYSRSVLYAYETALLSEIAEAGAAEVILLDCDALFPHQGDEDTDGTSDLSAADAVLELQRMARSVNEHSPETAVGVAFSPAFLLTRDSDRYLESIAQAFDLILLDLRAAENESDPNTAVSTGISEHLYFVLRYSMRVLIPAGSAEAAIKVSVENWQEGTLPKAPLTEES